MRREKDAQNQTVTKPGEPELSLGEDQAIGSGQRRRLAKAGQCEEAKSIPERIATARTEAPAEQSEIQFQYWIEHAFKPWLENKSKLLVEATDALARVAELHVPEWEMAAAARAGDMQVHMDQELARVPIPPAIAGDEKLETIYRDAMDDKREPYRQGAIGAFEFCLSISVKVRWFDDTSRHCEQRLNELLPQRYRIAEEIMPTTSPDLSFVDAPGPILERKKEADPNVSDIDPLEGL